MMTEKVMKELNRQGLKRLEVKNKSDMKTIIPNKYKTLKYRIGCIELTIFNTMM